MATQAGVTTSRSSGVVVRTAGSGGTSGGPSIAISGCSPRTSRAGPQNGSSWSHSARTASAGPTMEEPCRPCRRARSAKTSSASAFASTGTRLAPDQHRLRSSPPSYQPQNSPPAPRCRLAYRREATKRLATRFRAHSARASSTSWRPRTRTEDRSTPASSLTAPLPRDHTRAGDRSADGDHWGALGDGLAHLVSDPHRLLDEGLDDLRLRDRLDHLPLDEDLPLAVAGGDPEVRLAGLAGPVDDATHDGHPQRDLEPVQPRRDLLGELVDVDLGAPARGAGDDLELARPEV